MPEYVEITESFVFSEQGKITIPKAFREKAYTIAIDCQILSISREIYLDYGSYPANGFYGKAVLVFQDFSCIEINLSQARQRLYFERISEAFSNYQNIERTYNLSLQSDLANASLKILIQGLGFGTGILKSLDIEKQVFVETMLREVYIKSFYGTKFSLEVSSWQPEPLKTPNGLLISDGRSVQIDGDKDDGLPENGTQPKKATNPSNPYQGLIPDSSDLELGDFLNKKDNLDNSTNDGSDISDWGYFARIVWTRKLPIPPYDCKTVTYTFYRLCPQGTTSVIAVLSGGTEAMCGEIYPRYNMVCQPSGQILFNVSAGTLTATVIRSPFLPPDEPEVVS